MSAKTNKSGSEAFSIDPDGNKVDSHIHWPILDDGGPDDPESYAKLLKSIGLSKLAETPEGYASGGAPPPQRGEYAPWDINQGAHWRIKGAMPHVPHRGGMIKSSIPGRTDKIPLKVPAGSYIIPADIPSALGEGNTMAGSKILGRMFGAGPYGSGMTGKISAGRPHMPSMNWMRPPRSFTRRFADGGETNEIPIIAAGGEYVVHPDQVREIGHGDIDAGHRVLDQFVLATRKKHIETLKKLKPPKK